MTFRAFRPLAGPLAALVAASVVGGCRYAPTPREQLCGPVTASPRCPDGYTCVNEVCRRSGTVTDGGGGGAEGGRSDARDAARDAAGGTDGRVSDSGRSDGATRDGARDGATRDGATRDGARDAASPNDGPRDCGVPDASCICQRGDVRVCTASNGCSGTQACAASGWGACVAGHQLGCPQGWQDTGKSCSLEKTTGMTLQDSAGGSGYTYGTLSLSPPIANATPVLGPGTYIRVDLLSGSCNSGTDPALDTCAGPISQTDSGSSASKTGRVIAVQQTSCKFVKHDAWTPSGQTDCHKFANLNVEWSVPYECL
jgi:hypothetical protein